jgi:hypothetical protein
MINNGSDFLIGDYRQLTSLLLNDKIEAVEGLIVDTHNGGIGFRNHSIPVGALAYGAEWTEDILFIQPETQCVDTNLTFDFLLPNVSGLSYTSMDAPSLTDRGGFKNIDRNYEWWHLEDLGNNTQETLDLRERAYKAAWLNNGLTMLFMNVTGDTIGLGDRFSYIDSFIGKQFPLIDIRSDYNSSSYSINFKAIETTPIFGHYLSTLLPDTYRVTKPISNISLYKNPYNVTVESFSKPCKCKHQH